MKQTLNILLLEENQLPDFLLREVYLICNELIYNAQVLSTLSLFIHNPMFIIMKLRNNSFGLYINMNIVTDKLKKRLINITEIVIMKVTL